MPDNNNYQRISAIESAIALTQKYDIDRCIHAAYRFCIALEDKKESGNRDAFRELYAESDYDPCLDEVSHLITGLHGCNQFLSALYFVKGDRFNSDLWQQKHLLVVSRIFNRPTELNDGDS